MKLNNKKRTFCLFQINILIFVRWEEMPSVRINQTSKVIGTSNVEGIDVKGFTGQYRNKLNGFYVIDKINDNNKNLPLYKHSDDGIDNWLEFDMKHNAWQFKTKKSLNTEHCWAFIETEKQNEQNLLPHELNNYINSSDVNDHEFNFNQTGTGTGTSSSKNLSLMETFRSGSVASAETATSPSSRGTAANSRLSVGGLNNSAKDNTYTEITPQKFKWYAKNGFTKQTIVVSSKGF